MQAFLKIEMQVFAKDASILLSKMLTYKFCQKNMPLTTLMKITKVFTSTYRCKFPLPLKEEM
jgi:hypothetical protein